MKKWIVPIVIILLIGVGYVAYNMIQQNKDNQQYLAALQIQIEELNAQLSGEQLTGEIDEPVGETIPEPIDEVVVPELTPAVTQTQTTSVVQETTTVATTPTTPPATQPATTPTVSPQYISAQDRTTSLCGYRKNDGLPSTAWGQAAKFINSKLQYVRDNGAQYTQTLINEAYTTLSDPTIDATEKCRQSWLIDELSNQKGYITSYQTQNGVTTLGVDFISLQDDISKIQWDGPPRLDLYKNTSTKVRYYTLSQIPVLQTLNLDSRGNVLPGYKYLTDFTVWLNEHCNQNPIYNGEMRYEERYDNGVVVRSGYTGEIDRKQTNGVDHFCVKNRLVEPWQQIGGLQFDLNGNLEKIDLNRRHLYMAG